MYISALKGFADCRDNLLAYLLLTRKSDLALCRMNIDVHNAAVYRNIQKCRRIPVLGQKRAVTAFDRTDNRLRRYRALVD